MGEKIEIPPVEEQKRILQMKLTRSLVKGDTWYLIDCKWMKSLKQFVGIEKWESSSVAHPGPIDNSRILDEEKGDIKKALVENMDYDLVPEDCWQVLVSWYGLTFGQKPIPRNTVGLGNSYAIVEVYPLDLRCVKDFEFKTDLRIKASKAEKIGDIEKKLRTAFKINNETNTKLWSVIHNDKHELLKKDSTAQENGLTDSQYLVIETQNPDGSWSIQGKQVQNSTNLTAYPVASTSASCLIGRQVPKSTNMTTYPVASTSATNLIGSASVSTGRSTRHFPVTSCNQSPKQPGLCGLLNLGNTCFMNSVLQCMSNCPPITEYFLDQKHLEELNETNPLGMKGEIAKAYGELIEMMWSGKNSFTIPQRFKIQVGIFNPNFCGCQQHDCQELLTFLLDGLHEDLNRIKSKPYFAVKDDNGREDYIVAQETWDNYRKRNDSIIVDTFHGLLKSRVVCPQCERLSVTFDPFCYLSLPLPLKKDRILTVRYIPYEGSLPEHVCKVIVPKKGTIKDLCMEVHHCTHGNPDHMLVAEITNCHFHKFFCNDDNLDTIEDKDLIYIFQLTVVPNPMDTSYMIFPVCFWEVCNSADEFSRKHIFGVPFILVLHRERIMTQDLHKEIIKKMQRHFDVFTKNDVYNGDYSVDIMRDGESNYQDSFFKLYVIDTAVYINPQKLIPDGEFYDLPAFLIGHEPEKNFGRLAILLQFTSDQRGEMYQEKPPAQILFTSSTKDRNKVTIQDCLHLFTTCEKLSADDAWYCPRCKNHQRATKKFDLWKLPKMLIIQLKRFQYTRYRRDKIDTLVEFPVSNLNMSEYVISSDVDIFYDLVGVCNHYGNMGGGHYTAYCKNKDTKKWYCFDDNVVAAVSEDNIVSPAAYVLFYMAKGDDVQGAHMDMN